MRRFRGAKKDFKDAMLAVNLVEAITNDCMSNIDELSKEDMEDVLTYIGTDIDSLVGFISLAKQNVEDIRTELNYKDE